MDEGREDEVWEGLEGLAVFICDLRNGAFDIVVDFSAVFVFSALFGLLVDSSFEPNRF